MQDFTRLNFKAFMPLTDEYAVSVCLMNPYFGWGSSYPDKTLYEIGVMRLINKETGEYELEQEGPNYYWMLHDIFKKKMKNNNSYGNVKKMVIMDAL